MMANKLVITVAIELPCKWRLEAVISRV